MALEGEADIDVLFFGRERLIWEAGEVKSYSASPEEKSFVHSAFKSYDFARSFNTGMHKCLDFAKDAAQRVGKFAKQKMDERQTKS